MKITKETKTVEVDVFRVDGLEFSSREDAEKHVERAEQLLRRKYYVVLANPDLTEGRGFYETMVLSTTGTKNSVYQYLMRVKGDPIALVQGVSPMDNYAVGKEMKFENYNELHQFLTKKRPSGIGDYRKMKAVKPIHLNAKGEEVDIPID